MVNKLISNVIVAVAVFAVLSGCLATPLSGTGQSGEGATVESSSSETDTPTYPTPMLTPAVDFADSVSEVPEGQTLLIQYSTIASGVGGCDGFWYDELAPAYDFDGSHLYGTVISTYLATLPNRSRVLIGKKDSRGSNGRGGEDAFIEAVDLLPQAIDDGIAVRAVDEQGAIVVEINGQPFWIYPGSHWSATIARQYGDCRVGESVTLTNFGLLRNEQIDIDSWDGVTRKPFKPGAVPVVAP